MTNENKNPNLKHNNALGEKRLIWGVPSNIMLGAIALVVITFVSIGVVASIVMFLVFIPPLIIIHKDDELALTFLLDKLRRPSFYTAGGTTEQTAKILIRKSHGTFEVKKLSNFQQAK